MPQERPNHYGHLVNKPPHHTLSDGTDISLKTVDEITAAQRRLSPKFPTIEEALERRRALRETIAARVLLGFGGIIALIVGQSFGWVGVGFGFGGFIVTCFYAGNRQYVRSGKQGSDHGHRPF